MSSSQSEEERIKEKWPSHLFVFYKISGSERTSWTYNGKFPSGWTWMGHGGSGNCNYPSEEQFSGNRENKAAMKEYLNNYFSKLKSRGVISKFKIRSSFKP